MKTDGNPQAKAGDAAKARPRRPSKILVIDVGGKRLKILATGQTEVRKAPSGKELTPQRLIEVARGLAEGWEYDAVSLGFPGLVGPNGPRAEPGNLAAGWVGFDFAAGFGVPVKVINDAAMQALGSYQGGRMLFLGLGTGVGSVVVSGRTVLPLELGQLRFSRRDTLDDVLGRAGLARLGRKKWRRAVTETAESLLRAFVVDYVMLGGGNAKHFREPPPGARLGSNRNAFLGGYRLWGLELAPTLTPDGRQEDLPPEDGDWRMV